MEILISIVAGFLTACTLRFQGKSKKCISSDIKYINYRIFNINALSYLKPQNIIKSGKYLLP